MGKGGGGRGRGGGGRIWSIINMTVYWGTWFC